MDPNAALEIVREYLADGNAVEARYAGMDLVEWVARGGFPPADPAWREVVQRAL